MTPGMAYGPGWLPPWRCTEKAECTGPNCTPVEGVGRVVMASTLDEAGLCVNCARTAASDDAYRLRLDA